MVGAVDNCFLVEMRISTSRPIWEAFVGVSGTSKICFLIKMSRSMDGMASGTLGFDGSSSWSTHSDWIRASGYCHTTIR